MESDETYYSLKHTNGIENIFHEDENSPVFLL